MKLYQIMLLEDAVEDVILLTDVSSDEAEDAFNCVLEVLHAHPEHAEDFFIQRTEEGALIIVAKEVHNHEQSTTEESSPMC